MIPTTCAFATLSTLPSLTDTAYLALETGHSNAVAALARMMQRQAAQNALLEQVFGGAE